MQSSSETASTAALPAAYARRKVGGPRTLRRWWFVGPVLVLAGGAALGLRSTVGGWLDRLLGSESGPGAHYEVQPVTLNITLAEGGELKPRESIEVKCEVEGTSTILYVVPESSRVKKGDLLVELASDTLEERLRSKQMELRRIQADYEAAVEELAIQKNQNQSNIKKAQIDLEVAELDLRKYLEGDFPGQLQSVNVEIQQSEMDIARKENELEENQELEAKGWVTKDKLEQLQFALKVARLQLDRHRLSKQILMDYENPKVEKQRTSAVDRAREELGREEARAQSREKQSQARVDQYKDQLDNSARDCGRLQILLNRCKMYAPADGIVQYPSGDGHRWGGGDRIAAGERVREGQTLIVLPDTSQMLVQTRIHEADRHMVKEGLPCVISVPAVPGESFTGTIIKIDKFADSENRWLNPDLKEHGTEILLDTTDAPLSPGDSAEVKILIGTIENALAVPVQCVFTRGSRSFVFVRSGGSSELTEVTLGRSNASMVEIEKGLTAGQHVLMHADEQLLAQLPAVDTTSANQNRTARATAPRARQPDQTQKPQRRSAEGKANSSPRAAAGGGTPAGKSGD